MSDAGMTFYAHSENAVGDWHPLLEHLAGVAAIISEGFAVRAPWLEEAVLAATLHDLGKYGDRFQARLRGEDSGLDHWSKGTWLALNRLLRK